MRVFLVGRLLQRNSWNDQWPNNANCILHFTASQPGNWFTTLSFFSKCIAEGSGKSKPDIFVRSLRIKKLHSKHLLVFKTSWRHLQDMSWRCLQHVFSVTILHLPRRLEDVLQRRFEDVLRNVLKMSSRRLEDALEDEKLLRWRRLEDVLKIYLEDVFKTSPRQTKSLLMILYLRNLNVYLTNLCFTNYIWEI